MASLLDLYRKSDEKSPQGEVLPEQQTLNSARIVRYMKENGYTTLDNFDNRFNVDTALEILNLGGTRGEQEMIQIIQDGQSFLASIGRDDLMVKSPGRSAFNSTVEKELIKRNQMNMQSKIMKAYDTYATVRNLCRKRLAIREKFAEQREDEKTDIGKGIKETMGDAYKSLKKNYRGMSGKEKMLAVGAIILTTIFVLKSDNEHVKKAKEYLWSALKIGGVAVGANYVWKLFSGKTALEAIDGYASSSAGSEAFWTETFKTDSEKGQILSKSIAYLGDRDFMDLADRYRKAKARGEKKIELASVSNRDMSPEEIYTALDVFFSKYPVEQLQLRYRRTKAKPDWTNVVTTSVTEDGMIEFNDNLYKRVVSGIESGVTRSWNWVFVTGEGFGVMRYMYLKAWGKEGSDEEVKTWFEKNMKQHLDNAIGGDSELPAFCDRKFKATHGPHFTKAATSGLIESQHPQIKYYEVPGDAIYLISTVSMNPTRGNERMVSHMLENSLEQSDKFLKQRYPQVSTNINKFRQIAGGCRVVDNSTFKLFVKMPVPGSPEYSRRSVLTKPEKSPAGSAEIFKPDDVIKYSDLLSTRNWDAERLRIHFMIDSSNTANLESVCKWFTDEYRHKALTKVEVMRIMLEDDQVRDKCMRELGLPHDLASGYNLLRDKEDELEEIERDVAASVDSSVLSTIGEYILPDSWVRKPADAYEHLITEMKRNLGYKIRLAFLGDTKARAEVDKIIAADAAKGSSFADKLKPWNWFGDDTVDLMDFYEEKCEQLVEKYKGK